MEETAWVQAIADSKESHGKPHEIVAQADFSADDIESLLNEHSQYANIQGIRDVVHEGWIDPDHSKPSLETSLKKNTHLLNY